MSLSIELCQFLTLGGLFYHPTEHGFTIEHTRVALKEANVAFHYETNAEFNERMKMAKVGCKKSATCAIINEKRWSDHVSLWGPLGEKLLIKLGCM